MRSCFSSWLLPGTHSVNSSRSCIIVQPRYFPRTSFTLGVRIRPKLWVSLLSCVIQRLPAWHLLVPSSKHQPSKCLKFCLCHYAVTSTVWLEVTDRDSLHSLNPSCSVVLTLLCIILYCTDFCVQKSLLGHATPRCSAFSHYLTFAGTRFLPRHPVILYLVAPLSPSATSVPPILNILDGSWACFWWNISAIFPGIKILRRLT